MGTSVDSVAGVRVLVSDQKKLCETGTRLQKSCTLH